MWIVRPKPVPKRYRFKWFHYAAAGVSAVVGGIYALAPEFESRQTTQQKK
jgi:hypothetical protein